MTNILLTGGSGFLGTAIRRCFSRFHTFTVGRTQESNYIIDLSKSIPNFVHKFDLVVHAAGKAHMVPKNKQEEKMFFDVNVEGTKNLLLGLEKIDLPRNFVFISSVAVYGCSTGELINENWPLLATDSYGRSKIEAEYLVSNWCKVNSVKCTILRLPLLGGPNPPGNLKSMINGIQKGYYFNVAGGNAKKSIVLAKDVANIIPVAAEVGGVYNLTDGCHPSFSELSLFIAEQLGKGKPRNIPMWLAKSMAKAGNLLGANAIINSDKLRKITSDLTFDDSKARDVLGWNPSPVLNGFRIP